MDLPARQGSPSELEGSVNFIKHKPKQQREDKPKNKHPSTRNKTTETQRDKRLQAARQTKQSYKARTRRNRSKLKKIKVECLETKHPCPKMLPSKEEIEKANASKLQTKLKVSVYDFLNSNQTVVWKNVDDARKNNSVTRGLAFPQEATTLDLGDSFPLCCKRKPNLGRRLLRGRTVDRRRESFRRKSIAKKGN
ncbi:hypothetical protein L484_012826 [Morus notabilis]|uniref:Uncharacterized protein n=1 Tax=Morus notabilis TaxID=981085 RepID=W9QTK0_9ROSA|nr:hypothetical protein L484_012826 [Morus notabilis]